ncbi:MAG: hypothetical protein GY904_37015 [Planctomycetaceae bacterium]|nr:hypothetical protein [Planctomycetaceae bacterium]
MKVDDELLDRFLDGETSQQERQTVLEWLESRTECVALFAERAELHADVRRSLKRRGIQHDALNAMQAESEAIEHATHVRHRESRLREPQSYVLVAVVIATAAMLAFAIFRSQRSDDAMNGGGIARIVHQSAAEWVEERREGAVIGPGTLQLKIGLARLNFANGVSATLEGPAKFEVISGNEVQLHRGILTAHVPEAAIGFRIETPALQVVDLGTAFGVSVGNDGLTNVSVFEGEVEVNSQSENSGHVPAQRIVEGHAIRADRTSSTIETVEFETESFERAWPINSGVLQTTGVMKFVSPGPGFVPGRFEDSEHIVVFPERRNVLLESALRVDVMEPGEYRRLRDQPTLSLSTSNRVRSYLLQLNPSDRNRTMVMGQITFDRPILGLIASSRKLAESDSVLGHSEGIYEQSRRGIEAPRKDPPGKPDRDTVVLAADKRTLILSLGAGSALDQIRVIVDDTKPTWSAKSK